MKKMNRRDFLGYTGSALAVTVIPRHVLGGVGYVPPSDKINLALIGAGMQQLGELIRLIPNERVQVVSVCDPNKHPVGYHQWGPGSGLKNQIREMIGESTWGGDVNVTAGRDCGQDFINKYYARVRNQKNYSGCTAYPDFREMLEKEDGIDAVKIIVPDHAYPPLILGALNKNKHVIMHKPLGNRVHETRAVISAAREKPDLTTHMLAWSDIHYNYETVKKWIADGVIGTLREIHNWSFRPVWQQWQGYFAERPEVPKGFDWDLWLGAWPDRPYHPHYTHTLYRGWYDFGAGSIADMGIYSLWPLFTTFGIDKPPYSVDTMGTTTRTIGGQDEMKAVVNDVAFPLSSIIRWKFESSGKTGPFDLFWYDGGMRPPAPPEIEADNKELESEGMMFVGDKGKIVGGFRCENPVIIPEARMKEVTGAKTLPPDEEQRMDATEAWIDAILNKKQSPGSILSSGPVIETAHLAAVALRTGRKITYDHTQMKITNIPDANKYLYRSEYRPGWEI
ncbi:MAG: Gfo/Idh/MocA family oxidoreductase [Bacteroidales bacterium]|nr:Gfo/Idh/MocA family oxidoreductase [Bacteroidales bacterium]